MKNQHESINENKEIVDIHSWQFPDKKSKYDVDHVMVETDEGKTRFQVYFKDKTSTDWNEVETKEHFDKFGLLLQLNSKFGKEKVEIKELIH